MKEKRGPLVIVVGKFSDYSDSLIQANIALALRDAVELWKMGFMVFCPHTNSNHPDLIAWDDQSPFIEITKHLTERAADAVYALENYANSPGAREELDYAACCRVPLLFSLEQAQRFINEWNRQRSDD
jgi:hypothetical protein